MASGAGKPPVFSRTAQRLSGPMVSVSPGTILTMHSPHGYRKLWYPAPLRLSSTIDPPLSLPTCHQPTTPISSLPAMNDTSTRIIMPCRQFDSPPQNSLTSDLGHGMLAFVFSLHVTIPAPALVRTGKCFA